MHKRRHTGARRVSLRKKRKFELGRQPANTKMGERRVHLVRVRGGGVKFRALRLDTGNWSWATEACTRKARIISVVYNATSNELVRTNTLVKGAIVEIDAAPFKAWYLKYYGVHLGKQKKETEKEPAATTTKASEKAQEKPQEKAQQGKTKGGATGKKVTKEKPATTEKPKEAGKASTTGKTTEKAIVPVQHKLEEPNRKSSCVRSKLNKRNKTRQLESHLVERFNTGRLYARITSRPGQVGRCDGYILEGEELAFYLRKLSMKKKK